MNSISEEYRDEIMIDWSTGTEDCLRQLQTVFSRFLSGSDYSVARNTTKKEQNLNIFRKGCARRIGQVWPKVQSQTMDLIFTIEEIDSLKTKVNLPIDCDVKQPGRYPGLRKFKGVTLTQGAEIILALAR